jgi:hypothetical protein
MGILCHRSILSIVLFVSLHASPPFSHAFRYHLMASLVFAARVRTLLVFDHHHHHHHHDCLHHDVPMWQGFWFLDDALH